MRTLPIVHTLGGCGGTVLAKCLGSLDGVVLLSECNPNSADLFDQSLNPFVQVRAWYPEILGSIAEPFSADDMASDPGFCEFLRAIFDAAELRGERLVVRDYNYIDFFGVPFTEAPERLSSLRRALENTFELRAIVLVRHPLDQYRSLRSHAMLEAVLTPDIFLDGYHAFLSEVGSEPLVRYEDFVASPTAALQALCERFDLKYDEEVLTRFHGHQFVTGNRSRDAVTTISAPTHAGLMDARMRDLVERPAFHSLLLKLGYTPSPTPAGGRRYTS